MIGPRDNWAQTSGALLQEIVERRMIGPRDNWAQASVVICQGIVERRDDLAQGQLGSDIRGTLIWDNRL